MNKNTKDEWDNIWKEEGMHTWRTYPCTYSKICSLVGSDKVILELGCGIGTLSYQLKTMGNMVIGIDISEEAIKIMHQKYDLTREDTNLIAMVDSVPPVPAIAGVDYIVASQLLEHYENPDELVLSCIEVCDKAIFVVPDNVLGNDDCDLHHQKFTEESVKELLLKYYANVKVHKLIDIFSASNTLRIKIPVLICECWGKSWRKEK